MSVVDEQEWQESPGFDGDPTAGVIDVEPTGVQPRALIVDDVHDWAPEFKTALAKHHAGRIVYAAGHLSRGDDWRTNSGLPVGMLVHHTAGAATAIRDPQHKGNQPGANAGVVAFCINKNGARGLDGSHGFCNAVVDRDGTIVIVGLYAQWHAGVGSFTGTRWNALGVKKDMGNRALFGVEVVSKGAAKDFTVAQLRALDALAVALRESIGWPGFSRRVMNHKDWTGRKTDSRYRWQYFVLRARRAWAIRRR